ncbi:porin [Paraburkholderia tagetis]|uniref:Porin n=1 Tax=Paraburkholderia tagetis TaxID=2913261 RepID=A0A9X1UH23_9BURK|nr:porin [Paraburkholderia tagetis]MCG5076179.1 porin [Paraburkholderia tagetis]
MRFINQGICGATLALAAGSVAAQGSVTLYGVADTYIQYLNNGGSGSVSERSGGSTGSMIGLKGSEDLGGKLRAIFDLEAGYNTNNGTFLADSSALFYRQAWVGIQHESYGSLTFGRQYQPSFWAVYYAEPFRGNEVLSPLSAFDLAAATDRNTLATQYAPGRISNTIFYRTPNMGGVKLYAMYGFPASQSQPVRMTTGNMLDVALTYQGYGLYAALAYFKQHGGTETAQLAPQPLGATTFDLVGTDHYTAALAYRLGIVNLQFNYSYARTSDVASNAVVPVVPGRVNLPLSSLAHSLSYMEFGATIQATAADEIQLAALQRNVRGAHDNSVGFEAGIDHNISKRTTLYARAGYIKNNGTATTTWPGYTATSKGASQTLVAVGINHRF